MIKKISKKILIGASIIATITIIPIIAVACGSENNQNESTLSDLISKAESATITVNDKGKNILPSVTNSNNISEYITGLPTLPADAFYSYEIKKQNNDVGSIELYIKISMNSQSENTKLLTINGFQTNVQNSINQINALPNNTIKANLSGSLISASTLNSNNINLYITGIPTAVQGVIYTYKLNSVDDQLGSVNLTIIATQNGISQSSNSIIVLGFKSDTQIVNNATTEINSAAAANNIVAKSNNNILPTQLTPSNIAQNITGIPLAPEGITYTFSLIDPSDNSGTISIVITVSKGSVSNTTDKIQVQGFLTTTQQANQEFKNTIDNALSPNEIFAVPQNTTTSISITNANIFAVLAPFTISFNNLNILEAISNLEISVSNSNLSAGTVQLTFTSNTTAVNLSYTKSYSGFSTSDTNTTQTNIQNYLKTPNNALLFLSVWIKLNPNWIYNFISNNNNGIFKGFRINSTTPLKLNSMTISYNANGYFDIKGNLSSNIELQSWGGITFKTAYETTSDTSFNLILPITMDTSTGQGEFSGLMSPVNVNTINTGITTLSWVLIPADGTIKTFGLTLTDLTQTSDNSSISSLNIPYKLTTNQTNTSPATIANIEF